MWSAASFGKLMMYLLDFFFFCQFHVVLGAVVGHDLWLCFPPLQVNSEGKASPLSLLQVASPSGFCVLVRLPKLICGGKTLPKTLLDMLVDGTVFKVGVGCSEDASRLLRDYGLVVKGCLDLRYLAVRQGYGLYECWGSSSAGQIL